MKSNPEEILDTITDNPLIDACKLFDGQAFGAVLRNDQMSERIYETEAGELIRINVTVSNKPPFLRCPDTEDMFK